MPILGTARLVLRPFAVDDAVRVATLSRSRRVAHYLVHPPPSPAVEARHWIGGHAARWADGRSVTLAVTARRGGAVMGAVNLLINQRHGHAELGYWLGPTYWGRGFATEAAAALVAWAFPALRLERVYAQYLDDNRASGRVLEKIGMLREGVRRHHVKKDGRYLDAHQYGLLRKEWRKRWPVKS